MAYAIEFDQSKKQLAVVGQPLEFTSMGTQLTVEARVKFYSIPGTHLDMHTIIAKMSGTEADYGWQVGLINQAGVYQLVFWGAKNASGTSSIDFRYDWEPDLDTWYTLRFSRDMSVPAAYVIIDGVPHAMTNLGGAAAGALYDGDSPVYIGFRGQNGTWPGSIFDGAISHLIVSDEYVTSQDTMNYPLWQEPDHLDYDLTAIVAYWKCQSITNTDILVDEVSDAHAQLTPGKYATFAIADTECVVVSDHADLRITGDIALSLIWTPTSVTGTQVLAGRWKVNSYSYLIYLVNSSLYFAIETGTGNYTNYVYALKVIANYVAGRTYHIMGTADVSARNAYLYVDGAKQDATIARAGTGTTIFAGTEDLVIGASELAGGGYTNYVGGSISNVRLYDKYFDNENDVAAEIADGAGGHANLVAWWPLGEDFNDYGGSGHHGTETSGTIPFTNGLSALVSGYPFGAPTTRRKMNNLICN